MQVDNDHQITHNKMQFVLSILISKFYMCAILAMVLLYAIS